MMSSINACFIMLVLSSIGAIAKTKVFNDSAGPEEEAYYYYPKPLDFYYFVQRWPASYCDWNSGTRGTCCSPKKGNGVSTFSIHGLWPTYNRGRGPQDCCSPITTNNLHDCQHKQFIPAKISDLEQKLDRYWPSIMYTGTGSRCSTKINVEFWKHEWEKHGTCSPLNLEPYFQDTLSLRDRIHLHGALKTAGIYPNGNDYSLTDITNAIRRGTGKHPRIQCNRNRAGKSQLFEVYVCVDKIDAYTFIDCPTSQTSPRKSCDRRVLFPRFGQ